MIVVDASALVALAALPIRCYSHDLLIPRVWQLRDKLQRVRRRLLALAEALDAALLTCDRRLASAPGRYVSVQLI